MESEKGAKKGNIALLDLRRDTQHGLYRAREDWAGRWIDGS